MTYSAFGFSALLAACAAFTACAEEMPGYEHIFVIVAENKKFDQIIGRPEAPRLNGLAKEYGLATQFYGEVHPSEGNYVAMLAGDTFGIHDDDAWYCEPLKRDGHCLHSMLPGYVSHSISAPSLMDQLEGAKLTWKGYFEDLPEPGSLAIYDPAQEHPDPGRPSMLYASKHNGFVNFERVRQDPGLAQKIVPLGQLHKDLAAGAMPNYAHIVFNQCNDMHGLYRSAVPTPPEDCGVGRGEAETSTGPVKRGDAAIGSIVDEIVAAPVWSKPGNVAIVITWDEDGWNTAGPQGCCGFDPHSEANFGGGHIATIVVTNHGPRHAEDPQPYNHYSLLRSTEEAFGIREYLGLAGASDKGVKAMTPLFALPPEPAGTGAADLSPR
ncbi:MAG: alkaline phosphatase family protein [Rhodomicrobium sp.]